VEEMFSRRRSRILIGLAVLVAGIGVLLPRQPRFDRSKISIESERWNRYTDEKGWALIRISNGTNREVTFFSGQTDSLEEITPGQGHRTTLYMPTATLQIYVHPWTVEEKEQAEARYRKFPEVIRVWLMRRYLLTNPKHRYMVTLPPDAQEP
jgi:hypothetical protein